MRKLFALILCVVCLSGCAGVRQRWSDAFRGRSNRLASASSKGQLESSPPGEYSNDVVERRESDDSDAEVRQKRFSDNATSYHAANPPRTEMPVPPGWGSGSRPPSRELIGLTDEEKRFQYEASGYFEDVEEQRKKERKAERER